MKFQRYAIHFLAPFFIGLWLIWIVEHASNPPTMDLVRKLPHCTTPPTIQIGYQEDTSTVYRQNQGFILLGNAWLEMDVCTTGKLIITAHGETAGTELPRLDISLNSTLLWTEGFKSAHSVTINVSKPGIIRLSYLNDYSKAVLRLLTFERINFVAPTCHLFDVKLHSSASGHWSPESQTLWVANGDPVILAPCASGELSFRFLGQAVNGILPRFTLVENGHTILSATGSPAKQFVRLHLNGDPIQVRLINPYARQVEDRNLIVDSITFVADPPEKPALQ